jgi:rhodanese-related sulfurtransferase
MDTYLEFTSNHPVLVTGLMLSFLVAIFYELRRKATDIANLDPQAAVNLINADAVIIDLRSPEAFARGHIVNAKNFPYADLDANQEKIARFKSKPILTVCDAGINSSKAMETLRKGGIESVYGLKGGIAAWTQANLPLVTAKKTKRR